jgi:spore coat protein CotH
MRPGLRDLAPVCALGVLLATPTFGQQPGEDFFDDTVIHDVRIDLDPDDWAALRQNYLEDTYYHASVSSGSFQAANVGIRSRGRGSRSAEKPNLDVNVDKYNKKQTFAELGFFVLKANNQDASLMHEPVAFKLFQRMGLPASREAPARLFINGEYFGFYTIVEHVDEDFLDRNLGESGGDLFEWKPNAFFQFQDLGDDPAAYAIVLDPKTNEDNPNYQKFIDLIHAINDSPEADFAGAVSRYLNPELYLAHAAAENALAEIDGIWDSVYGTNNIYLYRFQDQDLFQLIVWDKDLTFLQPQRTLPLPVDNVLARRLLAIPQYRSFYFSQLARAADLLGGAGGWGDQEVNRTYALIHDAAVNDPHKQCVQTDGSILPCGPAAFEQGVAEMRAFIAQRAAFIVNSLPH